MNINEISGMGLTRVFAPESAKPAATASENAGKFFQELVGKVNEMQIQSDQAIQQLATGENRNLHETMIAVEKASISFQFMSQIRNKALEAYQEVMRMPV